MVVVTVGQRLNVFGYLSLPQLSSEQDGISGNYGLMDEVKALDWVVKNIAAFGGDPEKITIGGQSGGTAKTGALATCPMAAGKVKRVINQSALNWDVHFQTVKEGEENGKAYLEVLGLDPSLSAEELRKIPIVFTRSPIRRSVRPAPGSPVQWYATGNGWKTSI